MHVVFQNDFSGHWNKAETDSSGLLQLVCTGGDACDKVVETIDCDNVGSNDYGEASEHFLFRFHSSKFYSLDTAGSMEMYCRPWRHCKVRECAGDARCWSIQRLFLSDSIVHLRSPVKGLRIVLTS